MADQSPAIPRWLRLLPLWLALYVLALIALAATSLAPQLSPGTSEYVWLVAWDYSAPGRSFMRIVLGDGAEGAVRLVWVAGGGAINAMASWVLCFAVYRRASPE